jgi:hypothetical protein
MGAVKYRAPGELALDFGVAVSDGRERLRPKGEARYRMPLRTTDYIDVAVKARELGCRVPVGIALLPGNFSTAAGAAELRYHEAAPEVRRAWRDVGLIDAGPNLMLEHVLARGPEATGSDVPLAVFFGVGLRSAPARLVTYALGTVASVLAVRPGRANAREIRFDAVVERPSNGGYACIEYRGDAYDLVALAGAVRRILAGDPSLDGDPR